MDSLAFATVGGSRQRLVELVALVASALVLANHPLKVDANDDTVRTRTEPRAGIAWTGWLGAKRDGWVSHFRPPTKWPKELKRVWQVKVGTGYGSPLVAGGRVYQHARQGDGEVVWCLDLKSGDVQWRKRVAVPFKIGGGGQYHGKGPKSCPVLANGKLFTMSIAGTLTAWDAASGKQLWHRDYGKRFKTTHPRWGAAGSPIVDGNCVIAHFGTDGQGALIALDVATGKEVWTQGKVGPSYSSPLVATIAGVRQVIDWNEKALVGVESKSGRLLWSFPAPQNFTDQNMPTPVFHKGRILLGAENRGIRGLDPLLENGTWKVREAWHQKKVALDMATAVINGDLLYGLSHYGQGRIFCLDPNTGNVLWQGPGRTGQNATFLAIPGFVIALNNKGQLEVVKTAGDGYMNYANYRVSENATWAPPVLLKDGFLVKDKDTLSLWSLATLKKRKPARNGGTMIPRNANPSKLTGRLVYKGKGKGKDGRYTVYVQIVSPNGNDKRTGPYLTFVGEQFRKQFAKHQLGDVFEISLGQPTGGSSRSSSMKGGAKTFYSIVVGRLKSKDVELGEFTLQVDYVTSIYGDRRHKDAILNKTIKVVGVAGAWLDKLLLLKRGETLKFRSGTIDGTTISLSPKATVLEKAVPFDAKVYPIPPNEFRGFRGVVTGKIVSKSAQGYELTLRVETVERTIGGNAAAKPRSIEGRLLDMRGFYNARFRKTFDDLRLGDTIRVGAVHSDRTIDPLEVSTIFEKVDLKAATSKKVGAK